MMNINERAMIVRLSISQWTAKKVDKKATKEVAEKHGNTEDWGKFNKTLVSKEALEDIAKIATDARTYHYSNTLPWDDNGGRILPSVHYMEYSAKMRDFENQFYNSVKAFLSGYSGYRSEAQLMLNGLFDPADYPSESDIFRRYGFGVTVYPIPSGNDFRVELDSNEVAAIRADLEKRANDTLKTAMRDLWGRLHDAVSRMVERLGNSDAVFRDSLVDNVRELCALLPKLNLAGDGNLERMRQEVESKLSRFSPQVLRDNKPVRAQVAQDAKAILDSMSAFMGVAA